MKEKNFEKFKENSLSGLQIKQIKEGAIAIRQVRKSGDYQKYYNELRERYREKKGPESYREIFDIDLKVSMDDILIDPQLSDKAKWDLIKDYREIEVDLRNRKYEDVRQEVETIINNNIGPMIELHPNNYKDMEALNVRIKHLEELKEKGELPASGKFHILGVHAKRFLEALKQKGLIEEK